jgi:hypothetical protein
MKKFPLLFSFVISAYASVGLDDFCSSQLFRDLETVELIDRQIEDRLPALINFQQQGGYFTMPSARTFQTGEMGLGYAFVPPYHLGSLGFQFFDHIETSGNYWIYRGVPEGNFGRLGFGDDAERSANVKFILLKREDGFPFLPDLAFGWNDFLGSCRFKSFYVVGTQGLLGCNLEATLGWGKGRIQGFFGGLAWTPFRRSSHLLKDLSLVAEYDANNYKKHAPEHPLGREVRSRINLGAQLSLLDCIHLSASTLRGSDWAGKISFRKNLGETDGFFPKFLDPQPYTAPIDTQPLGVLRSRQELAQELAFALQEQGFDLYRLSLIPGKQGNDSLWLKIVNLRYREEDDVRKRIQYVLAFLSPSNISSVTAVIEADGILTHEYRFRIAELQRFAQGKMGEPEFRVIAPYKEVSSPPKSYESALLYKRRKPIWMLTFRPWLRSFFGSSSGKYKYETGLSFAPEGYLFDEIYYYLNATYTVYSSTQSMKDRDLLNPSRLINVRTDSICYNQSQSFHIEQAFIQKSWNLGQGWFSRLSLGYFEMAYAGASIETLYYPVQSAWAIGFEASTLWKREYYGLGFQHKIRKLTSEGYQYFPYTGLQYFVDIYYQFKPLDIDFKASVGQFLARDKGVRFEGSRTFSSGLRVGLWYTLTNADDIVNNSRYYDKGFLISFPLDFFLNKSSRTRLNYSMSAWLRDCGARANNGKQLYPTLYWERYNSDDLLY